MCSCPMMVVWGCCPCSHKKCCWFVISNWQLPKEELCSEYHFYFYSWYSMHSLKFFCMYWIPRWPIKNWFQTNESVSYESALSEELEKLLMELRNQNLYVDLELEAKLLHFVWFTFLYTKLNKMCSIHTLESTQCTFLDLLFTVWQINWK